MPGETVLECLTRRSELLTNATLDDNYLEDMVAGLDVLSNLTTKQKNERSFIKPLNTTFTDINVWTNVTTHFTAVKFTQPSITVFSALPPFS